MKAIECLKTIQNLYLIHKCITIADMELLTQPIDEALAELEQLQSKLQSLEAYLAEWEGDTNHISKCIARDKILTKLRS